MSSIETITRAKLSIPTTYFLEMQHTPLESQAISLENESPRSVQSSCYFPISKRKVAKWTRTSASSFRTSLKSIPEEPPVNDFRWGSCNSANLIKPMRRQSIVKDGCSMSGAFNCDPPQGLTNPNFTRKQTIASPAA